jgi:hypothetical protein
MPKSVMVVREHGIQALLACNHYTDPIHRESSTWDHPDEVLWCDKCGKERQMHINLQLFIYNSEEY